MSVSMVKRVSFVKRVPAGMLTGIESVPSGVSMVKRDGPVSHFPGVGSPGGESRTPDAEWMGRTGAPCTMSGHVAPCESLHLDWCDLTGHEGCARCIHGTAAVPLAKAVTAVRAVRLHVASHVLAYIDIVELSNGAVWTVTGRLPNAYPWEPRHVRTRARRDDFVTALCKRIAFESSLRPLVGVKILR